MSAVGSSIGAYSERAWRQPGAFALSAGALEALQARVFPMLLDRAVGGTPARVWVPGCGTGGHAYLMAMLLIEQFSALGWKPNIQIFATDSERRSIDIARSGVYSAARLEPLDNQLRKRFFSYAGNGQFAVSTPMRECVVFSTHDLLADAPLSRLDLISFPGTLHEADPTVQQRLLQILHSALEDNGYLLFGEELASVSLGNLFEREPYCQSLHRRLRPGRHHTPSPVPVERRALQSDDPLRRFAAVLRNSEDAIMVMDLNGHIRAWNRGAERLYGYSEAEGLQLNLRDLVTGLVFDNTADVLRRVVAGKIVSAFDAQRRARDGRLLEVSVTLALLRDSSGNPEAVVATERDITARRRAEQETRGLNALLEECVAQRATELKALQQEILDIAMLEQRRIGQELHDGTQQELTGLGLLAQNLAEELKQSGSQAAGELAARVAHGIEQTNQRIRSLARGMVPVPVGRDGLMSALIDLARQTTELHRLPCAFECPAPVEIGNDSEATHLYRIAQEAVTNAVRHARASAMWIRLEQLDGRLLLEVRDNGIGVGALGPGHGVGLRLMEHRCGMMSGTFALEPRADGGARIVCSIPRSDHE